MPVKTFAFQFFQVSSKVKRNSREQRYPPLQLQTTQKMAKFIGSRPHTAITYLPHLLLFASFGVLLGGLAAMQNECGAGVNNEIVGSTTYLAPVS